MHDVIEISSQASSSPVMTSFSVIELTDDSEPEIIVETTTTTTTSKSSSLSKKRKLVLVDSDSDEDKHDNANTDVECLAVKLSPTAPVAGPSKSTHVAAGDSLVSKTKDASVHKRTKLFISSRAPSPSPRSSNNAGFSFSRDVGSPPENTTLTSVGPLELELVPVIVENVDSNTDAGMARKDKGKGKGKARAVDDDGGDRDEMSWLLIDSHSSPQHSPTNTQTILEPPKLTTDPPINPTSNHQPLLPAAVTANVTPTSRRSPPPPPPPPLLETPEETMARYTAQILEIIPDVEPGHCAALVADRYPDAKDATVERVLHFLFEDPSYPKIQNDKGKRKAVDGDEAETRPRKKAKLVASGKNEKGKGKQKADGVEIWLDPERPFTGGKDYQDLALNQLQQDYPLIPKQYLRSVLFSNKEFYAPAFFYLRELERKLGADDSMDEERPYEPRKSPFKPSKGRRKGKQQALEDDEFQRERVWVRRIVDIEDGKGVDDENDLGGEDVEDDADGGEDDVNEESEGEDEESGIECGCCFSKFRFEKMVQCPDAHLFCRSCLRSYASTLLGTHNPHIPCMSQSPCQHSFPSSQLVVVLPRKTYALYERLLQAQEIAKANLEGLEECPFCEWKCVFDVGFEQQKLFRCDGCGGVSCRNCKKLDHLPKSCEEVEKDRKLNARHEVEEAMTKALMRNCPKCQKAFIKISGCNKMTCPNCHTMSCYICRKVVSGYEHFYQGGHQGSSSKGKCILWDGDLEAMHATEVKKAAEEALQKVKSLHPDVSDSDLKVDLPKSKRPANAPVPPVPPPYYPVIPPLNPPIAPPYPQWQAPRAQAAMHHLPHNRRGGPPPRRPRVPNPYLARPRHQPHHPHPQAHPHPHPHPHPQAQAHHNQPPRNPVPFEPLRPYHEVVAQAMMGRYEPPGGGMEIGGRVLRTRPARVGGAPAAAGANIRAEPVPVYHLPPPQAQQQLYAPPREAVAVGGMHGAANPGGAQPQWANLDVGWRVDQILREHQPVRGVQQQQQQQQQAAQWVMAQQRQQEQQEQILAQQRLQNQRVALQQQGQRPIQGQWQPRR